MPKQLFRYAFCGSFAVFIDILIFTICEKFVFHGNNVEIGNTVFKSHTVSIAAAFIVSQPLGFFLQKYITFTNSNLRGRVQLFRYFLIVMVCLAMNYYGIGFLKNQRNIDPTVAKIIVTVFVVAFSYISQRYFSFKEKKEPSY